MRIIDTHIKCDADPHLGKEPNPMSLSSPSHGPDLRGEILDHRYRLDEFIASGGSGTVYAGVDRKLRRPVAVKVIHPEYARTEDQRRRIRQEALLGAVLDHPNLAPILDFGAEVEGRAETLLYIVMPLLAARRPPALVSSTCAPNNPRTERSATSSTPSTSNSERSVNSPACSSKMRVLKRIPSYACRCCSAPPGHSVAVIEQHVVHLQAGNLDQADEIINQIIAGMGSRKSPELGQMFYRKALIARAKGDRNAELNNLQEALICDKDNGLLAAELAELSEVLENWDVAMRVLRTITMMDSGECPISKAEAYARQARIAHRTGDSKRAIFWARRATQEDPELEEAHALLRRLENE